ncbi:hypothetical protein J2Z49_000249 [Desulfofundulus luciae]|uniref:Copper amine oxidase-like N-terminal domain-containing protein n=1 Tax=Desulfofundulus luciae TaxID=74702 RepID=A0ABU0AYQ8_9FIRM|nr:copper amine oxidase N-terminal domain-containing protein [Desulfofundulus luciae]MDQ0285159.1 hypothetical protein [Desulfofundulus luciae]
MKFNRAHLIVIGLLCFWGVFLGGIAIGSAGNVLQSIAVDFYAVKKIIIDGADKTPPADKRPFVYNGTTYVPLRYVAEALGKQVKWDGATGTIYIGKSPDLIEQKVIYDDFSQPLSVNWVMDKGTWSIDPNNGAYVEDSTGYLRLDNNKYHIGENYTIECDVAVSGIHASAGVFVGGTPGDPHFNYPRIYLDSVGIVCGEYGVGLDYRYKKLDVKEGKFYKLKVSVRDNKVDVYLDGNYITSTEFTRGKGNLVGLYSFEYDDDHGYIRNFKITMDDKITMDKSMISQNNEVAYVSNSKEESPIHQPAFQQQEDELQSEQQLQPQPQSEHQQHLQVLPQPQHGTELEPPGDNYFDQSDEKIVISDSNQFNQSEDSESLIPVSVFVDARKDGVIQKAGTGYIKDNRIFIPVKDVALELAIGIPTDNIHVIEASKETLVIIKGDKVIEFKANSPYMFVNGAEIKMDVSPQIIEGKIMVPFRWVVQALGYSAVWEEDSQCLTIRGYN